MKNHCLLILPILMLSFSAFGQSSSEFERSFEFDEESAESEFVIEVSPGTESLLFALKSTINSGDLKVSLISPSGKKEGGFRLHTSTEKLKVKSKTKGNSNSNSNSNSNKTSTSTSTSTSVTTDEGTSENYVEVNTNSDNTYSYSSKSSSNTSSKGNMNKTITNPESGTWKVIINPQFVVGRLQVGIMQRAR